MSKKSNVTSQSATEDSSKMVFNKVNYQIMIAGVAVIALGFIIMMLETGENGIGFLGLTLGPIVVVLGFALEFAAIFYNPKKKDGHN